MPRVPQAVRAGRRCALILARPQQPPQGTGARHLQPAMPEPPAPNMGFSAVQASLRSAAPCSAVPGSIDHPTAEESGRTVPNWQAAGSAAPVWDPLVIPIDRPQEGISAEVRGCKKLSEKSLGKVTRRRHPRYYADALRADQVKGWKLHLVQPSALMQKQLLPQAAGQRCDYSHRESCRPSPHRAESAGDSGADNGLQRGAERSLCSALDPPPRRPPAGRRGRDKSSSACSGARARVRPPGNLYVMAWLGTHPNLILNCISHNSQHVMGGSWWKLLPPPGWKVTPDDQPAVRQMADSLEALYNTMGSGFITSAGRWSTRQ
ncbi:uncharacterized protein LOC111551390 [Piliocolobus tephrosceles]|uniref:uncharacterized protein LOC111551390 n=1 Tax=Piliocolobus tephrosceles TaxID=591936 RepID=UPI000C2B476F|nr:uncharacterized protein LOC111551390 [Piliocolobus tephrosceles]